MTHYERIAQVWELQRVELQQAADLAKGCDCARCWYQLGLEWRFTLELDDELDRLEANRQ